MSDVPPSFSMEIVSKLNSSTANLASGASFTGTGEDVIDFETLAISFKADQPVTIQINQSTDNINWDVTDSFTVQANVGDARTFDLLASFVQVVVTNNGASSTTFLRLQAILSPGVNPVPRSLSQLGNFRVAIQESIPFGVSGTVGVSGNVDVLNFPQVQGVSGSVSILNFPQTQGVSGLVQIGSVSGVVGVSGIVNVDVLNFPQTQGVSGSVSILNFPQTQGVSGLIQIGAVSGIVGVSGIVNVDVLNFPDTQGVSGTVNIGNFPAVQGVSGIIQIGAVSGVVGVSGIVNVDVLNFPQTQGVSGSVSILNFPNPQGVSGTVNIGNFPVIQGVSGLVQIGSVSGIVGVSGIVNVDVVNFPVVQGVSGSVSILNFPSTQGVSGSVSILNFPVIQGVSGLVQIGSVSGVVGVSGTVNVNIVGDQVTLGVSGSVSILNFPAIQGVSGTVTVNQGVSGTSPWTVKDVADGVSGSAAPGNVNVIGGADSSGIVRTIHTDVSGDVFVNFPPSLLSNGRLQVYPNFNSGTVEVFGALSTNTRHNQIQADFSAQSVSGVSLTNYVTLTTTGTASATLNNGGYAQFSSGTSGTADVTAISLGTVYYLPGVEEWAEFTAAFTTPTSANSFQKIGVYNSTTGFYVGYIGTSFGVTVRNSSVDTTTTQANWNVDTLQGAVNSQFTRGGAPEAINFTFLNLFRIRFGWLGSAPIYFEVMSPDGNWVVFHIIRQPNTIVTPTLTTPNLPITVDVNKASADATNLILSTACWAAGILDNKPSDNITAPQALSSVSGTITVPLLGLPGVGFQLNAGTFIGTITPQLSFDNGNTWINTLFYNPATQTTLNTLTFAASNGLTNLSIIPSGGTSHVRVQVTAYTSGSAVGFLRATSAVSTTITTSSAAVSSGTVFSIALLNFSLPTAATENPILLLKNPATNTKSMYIESAYCGINVANRQAAFEMYGNPTASVSGTNIVPVNRSIGSAATSVMIISSGPTITSNGSLFSTIVNAQNQNSISIIDAFNLKIPPGNSVLITGNPGTNSTGVYVAVTWSEY